MYSKSKSFSYFEHTNSRAKYTRFGIKKDDRLTHMHVIGKTGTLISFRVGAEDATYLAREFEPVFNSEDLIGLANHHIYLRLMIDGEPSKPFSATTLKTEDESL